MLNNLRMAVGDESYDVAIFYVFKEYIPSCGVIGFVENIFGAELGQIFRRFFERKNWKIVFYEIINFLHVFFCITFNFR